MSLLYIPFELGTPVWDGVRSGRMAGSYFINNVQYVVVQSLGATFWMAEASKVREVTLGRKVDHSGYTNDNQLGNSPAG